MLRLDDLMAGLAGFDWVDGNSTKNWERHQVTQAEAENHRRSPVHVQGPTVAEEGPAAGRVRQSQRDADREAEVARAVVSGRVRAPCRGRARPNAARGHSAADENDRLGVQAQIWTEYIASAKHVEYMAFPRMAALAEVAWTPTAQRQLDGFHARLVTHLERLKILDVNFRAVEGGGSPVP